MTASNDSSPVRWRVRSKANAVEGYRSLIEEVSSRAGSSPAIVLFQEDEHKTGEARSDAEQRRGRGNETEDSETRGGGACQHRPDMGRVHDDQRERTQAAENEPHGNVREQLA